ncbi:MAG: glycoside hydrolase family 43 protein [Spirochaetaceae bacterium]|jgi:xylan 1,4-beta-xylosidase|nr:glycoside hydrolase family 43 protein [Spirochaetaceae bacterium]
MNFTNPIITGSYPDPSICRNGQDYYMVSSSFEYFPGIPVLHSRDLIHWRQIGFVLDRVSQLPLKGMRSSGGIYAPTIRFNSGVFYTITTLVEGGGNFFVTATNPAGPWSNPVWIDAEGFDPSLFFDDDGTVYYTQQTGGRHGRISQAIIDINTGKLKNELTGIWDGTGGIWPEGPHLYKRNGMYFLLIAEGGTSYDHKITIARSENPMGPYISHQKNPILTHSTLPDHPFQAMGHCDFIETDDGWWTVLLGIREANNHMGRETFLAPVTWDSNDWPVINQNRAIEEIMSAPNLPVKKWEKRQFYYDFETPELGMEWNYIRNPILENYSLLDRQGYLRLNGRSENLSDQDTSTFIGQRQTAPKCRISTALSFTSTGENEEAGLAIRADDFNHLVLGLHRIEGENRIFFRETLKGNLVETRDIPVSSNEEIILLIDAKPHNYSFYFKQNEESDSVLLGESKTKNFVYEKIGNFMGVYIGLFATGNGENNTNPADFSWFRYDVIS